MHKPAKTPRHVKSYALSKRLEKLPRPGKDVVQAACDDAALRARQEILARLSAYKDERGLSYKATVLAFVGAVEAASQSALAKSKPQYVQIEGFDFPYPIVRDAKGRNDRRGPWRISARTIYSWKKLMGGEDASSPAPRVKITKSQTAVFNDACRFMSSAPDHMLDMLVAFYGVRLADALRRAGWVVQIEPVQSKR